jgi:hypothetical protein
LIAVFPTRNGAKAIFNLRKAALAFALILQQLCAGVTMNMGKLMFSDGYGISMAMKAKKPVFVSSNDSCRLRLMQRCAANGVPRPRHS